MYIYIYIYLNIYIFIHICGLRGNLNSSSSTSRPACSTSSSPARRKATEKMLRVNPPPGHARAAPRASVPPLRYLGLRCPHRYEQALVSL